MVFRVFYSTPGARCKHCPAVIIRAPDRQTALDLFRARYPHFSAVAVFAAEA